MTKIMEQIKKGVKSIRFGVDKVCGLILMLPFIALSKTQQAFANEWDFMATPAPQGAAFENVNKKVKETGQSAYGAVISGAVAIMIIGAVFIGVGIAITRNPAKKAENKSQLVWFILGGIVIFSGAIILAFSKNIATSLK